jgi:ribosome-binding protein aMBF1 (putative translation factor)
MSSHHQDWEPVIFNKKSAEKKTTPATTQKTSSSLASVGIYAAASDDDVKKTKYVSKKTSLAVSAARCEKKMTQKELAQKCNFDVSIVAEIERGTCVYNPTHVNKIQSVLGLIIPRS